MQTVKFYLKPEGVRAQNLDSFGAYSSSIPYITRGMSVRLELHLFGDGTDITEQDLPSMVAWEFAIAQDWDSATPPLIHVQDGITVGPDGTTVSIDLDNTNTTELIDALNGKREVRCGCELIGYLAGETTPSFLLQFDIGIRNRLSEAGTGTPAPVGDQSLTAAQIRALVKDAGNPVRVVDGAGRTLVSDLKKIQIGQGIASAVIEDYTGVSIWINGA